MSRIATFILMATVLLGAETSWTRVKDLKGRNEVRIYKKGIREPINATFDEASDERVIVVVKNKEVAIPKEDIDRIDARPVKGPRKMNVESTAKETPPDYTPRPVGGPPVPGTSASSNVNFGSGQSEFETIYRRSDAASKK